MWVDRLPFLPPELHTRPSQVSADVASVRDETSVLPDAAPLRGRPPARAQAALPPRMPLPRVSVPRRDSVPHAPPDPGIEDIHEIDRALTHATLVDHACGLAGELELDLCLRRDPLEFHVIDRLARDPRGPSPTRSQLLAVDGDAP